MPTQHVDTAMIIGCYLAIIGLYIYTFKTTQQVRDMVFKHQAEKNVHVNSEDIVYKDVCDERLARIDERFENIQGDVSEIKTSIHNGFTEVKEMLKEKA